MKEPAQGKSFISIAMAPTLPEPSELSAEKPEIQMAVGKNTSPINYRGIFFEIARQAIKAQKITRAEVEIIYRPHTRKTNYWARHIRDLVSVLADRGYEVKFPDLE